jgi:hypothetical protein
MTKIDPRWGPNMMRRPDSTREAQQVRCLTGDEGSEWIHDLDSLPAPVRRRLAQSVHNICPTCVDMEARVQPAARGLKRPTIGIYNEVISAIERKLDEQSPLQKPTPNIRTFDPEFKGKAARRRE